MTDPISTGTITIDLRKIAANWQALARLVAPADCAAVVKADAYGLGADRVIPALRSAGCTTFFIATPREARQARALVPDATVYSLDGLLTDGAETLLAANASPVLSCETQVREWSQRASVLRRRLPAALQIDTGLNRLGLSRSEVSSLIAEPAILRHLDIRLVMSHLACADDPNDPMNDAQRKEFDALRSFLPAAPASLAASDGLMLGQAFHYDLVRPGYALYGGQAIRGAQAPVKPALRVAARILQVRDVAKGESVGYAAAWRAPRDSRIAIAAAGYADGIPRSASSTNTTPGGQVHINGKTFPIAGRVSMDLITIDVTDNQQPIQRGDTAELIGPGLPIETVGASSGTIGYEILTRLGRRFERIYLEEGS